jgi:ferredoxin--NADP+ reductase
MGQLATQSNIVCNLFRMTEPLAAMVLENRRLTAASRPPANEVRHVVLKTPGLSYAPGQSIGVIPYGYDPRTGKPHKLRLYSVSSASRGDYGDGMTASIPVVRHYWHEETAALSPVPGVCSKYLCDCEPGEEVRVTGPVGRRFLLPADFHERDLIFIATGTGIAPYRGMLKEMFDQDYQGRVFLFFGVKYADCILYDDEFQSYVDRPNFRYITALSREAERNPLPDEVPTLDHKIYVHVRMWQYRHQIGEALQKSDTVVYLCGLKGMEEGVRLVLDRIGEEWGQTNLSGRMRAEGRLLLEVY